MRKMLFSATLVFLFHSSLSFALMGSDTQDSELASQRFHYQKAKQALADQQMEQYQTHFEKLGEYPLKQYLEFTQLRKELSELPFTKIDDFLDRYPQSFLARRLRVYVLQTLAIKQRWMEYSQYYREDINSTSLLCHSITARLKAGDTLAFNDVPGIWIVGKSQPDACDPVFDAWADAGHLTEEMVWARFDAAVNARKYSLARYLSKKLTSLKPKAELYLQLRRNPQLITKRDQFKDHDLPTQQIIAYGIQKLSVKEPLTALYHWELYEAQQIFPEDLSLETKLYVVKRLIRGGHAKEAQHLLSYSHNLREKALVEEIIRDALKEQDWQRVNNGILLLSAEEQSHERWQYWRARCQDELNTRFENFPESNTIYQTLSKNRSFYGFSSADKLRQKYELVDRSDNTQINTTLVNSVAQLAGMQRAYELWLTGNFEEAQAEWLHTSKNMNAEQLFAAGQLADTWGWHTTGIQAMINGNWWNQLTVRFPIAYQDEVYRIASDTQVEPTFIYAIARQESAFNSRARSPVGAMGLMQLMPQTAKFTAKTFGISHSGTKDLLDAEHNMRLGSHYLNYLLTKFNGNRILAAAAYNAGPHRVNRWLSEAGKERPFDVWIETIPFGETRQYVQNVLCFSVIYGYRLGKTVNFVSKVEANSYL